MRQLIYFIGLFFLTTICSFGQMKVTSGDVNLRTTPDTKGSKIGVIAKGTVVTIVQNSNESENWTKINFNGETYVHNNFLKNISADSKRLDDNKSSSANGVNYYKNSKGEKVQSPTKYDSAPEGATAECNDGTYSFSKSRRGTCSHHGGVKRWLK